MKTEVTNQIFEELTKTHWGIIPASISVIMLNQDLSSNGVWLIFWATLMASYDVAVRRIPNSLTAMTAIFGLIFSLIQGGMSGFVVSISSGLLGFGIMAVLFFLNVLGAGDVKAVASLAVFLSPIQVLYLILFTTISGGILAIISLIMAKRVNELSLLAASVKNWRAVGVGIKLPYALAILGACLWLVLKTGL